MNLSDHFTLEELVHSDTANEYGIDNTPSESAQANLSRVANEVLEPVRALLGKPMRITSGFRCPTLNSKIGSASTSQHILGEAADFQIDGMTPKEVCDVIAASDIKFGQLIEETGGGAHWTHISLATEKFSQQLLTIDANGTRFGIA